ncbi:MAG: beta propeller repeat protein [Acidimicrobiales bacterium]
MTTFPPRRRHFLIGIALLVAVVATVVAAVATRSPARTSLAQVSSEYYAASPGSSLNQVSLGPGTQLRAVDMLSMEFGFGVAGANGVGWNPDYLVTTKDGARHWQVVQRMRVAVVAPANSVEPNPTLLSFPTRATGYVSTSTGVDVTTNGGLTWTPVNLGRVLDWRADRYGLVAVTRACVQGCPLDVVTAPLGSVALRPRVIHLPSRFSDERVSAMALEGRGEWVLTNSPAVPSGDPHLWTISGNRLAPMADPCRGLEPEGYVTTQLLVGHAGTYLYCFADTGMNQGYNELWYRARGSSAWLVRQKVSPFSTAGRGSLGDSQFLLGLVNGGARLVAISEGAYTGPFSSADGGRTWSGTRSSSLATEGGAPMSVSPWGGGAIMLSSEGALFGTSSGGRILPYPLPTGVASKIPWCSPQATSVNLGPSGPFGDYVVTVQVQGALGASSCAFRGHAFIELTGSPGDKGIAKLLATPSQLTPWPADIVLGVNGMLDFTVRFTMGGSSCAPTFVPQVILDVGPERFLAWDTSRPSLGICIHHPAVKVGKPYTDHAG